MIRPNRNFVLQEKVMKTAVIYSSQTGFTKRYANWIASAAHADCLDVSAASTEDLSQYDAIVFGSWISGGYLHDLHWLKDNLPTCPDQKRILYIVGASPSENEEVKRLRKKCLRAFEEHNVKDIFYCPGGFNLEKLPASSKAMMKLFIRTFLAKKNKTEPQALMARLIVKTYDVTNPKYILPILDALKKTRMLKKNKPASLF